MNEIKSIMASKLVELRKKNKLTQAELAEKLNYSDKAISKWERGEAMPDIEILASICKLYGVTLDYLVNEGGSIEKVKKEHAVLTKRNCINISLISVIGVWIIALILYLTLDATIGINLWILFIWSLPTSAVLTVIFSALWGNRFTTLICTSVLLWTLLLSFYIQFIDENLYLLSVAGLFSQLIIIFSFQIRKK